MSARILFSNPPFWGKRIGSMYMAGVRAGSRWPFQQLGKSYPGRAERFAYCPYPMFMGFAATYATKAGADVTFRDSIATRESYESFYGHVAKGGYEYVVIETATPSFDHDAGVIAEIKRQSPDVKVIVTGTIGATRADEVMRDHPVHAVIRGEYEKGVVRVLNGESGVIDFDLLSVSEMNSQPPPYMDALHAPLYFDSNPKGQQWPHLQAWGSRGCSWRCLFCSFPATMTNNDPEGVNRRVVRFYNSDWLLSYIPQYVKDYGFKCVYFDGDTENYGDKHTLDLCRAMRVANIPWTAMCRIDCVHRETWREMKASRCVGVKIGYESGSQRVINDIIHKQLDLEKARETTRFLKSIGLTVHGTFSVGHPGETAEEMQMTRTYRESLNLDTFQESGMATLEGTPMDSLLKLGTLKKYPGAKVDGDFIQDTDGMRKLATMNKD